MHNLLKKENLCLPFLNVCLFWFYDKEKQNISKKMDGQVSFYGMLLYIIFVGIQCNYSTKN